MKVTTPMRRLKNAKISFISLVNRGANRIPFRVIKSESGESAMLNLARVLKNSPSQAKPQGFAHILKADPFRASKAAPKQALQPAAKAPASPQTTQQAQQCQQVEEERQRQQPAPNQAPTRRASNTPKVPAPARDTVTLKELRGEIDTALRAQRQKEQHDQWNAGRSAFTQISPTQPHHTAGGGRGSAWDLRNRGGQLATAILSGEGERLPSNTAFRPFSAAGAQA